ncbi:hypothetical protein EIJ81_03425 [Aliivibrio salmonicida]|uniref:Uncharacterized protein n=1 Tax=Aliivibrio salmonicida (strain LFI1238) TaxID=316275 RepID=B6ELL2_ALISL|nr:hypothetical protein [Aliivibrio salmonicida]AZL83840.1 hypothetical protein EIJ81_03425 [Aliivibrio salmonicida]CAQ78074.1 hypothetical protein, putative phage gene [Aliivibrio salmonicida LFI1238]
MLKNWTVITQAVKNGADGIMARERYLLSTQHPNHKHTELIIPIIGNKNTSLRIAIAGEKFKLQQKINNKKGGRPLSSFGMEYCLTLPKIHRPTPQQWRAIIADCCMCLAYTLKLNPNELIQYKSQIRAVLHQQPQIGRTGSGDHVHLIIGKVINNKVLKELQQKKVTSLIKQAFNTAVLKHVGLDHREYKTYELSRGKRLETWKYQHQKAEESICIQKNIIKLQNQTNKWLTAFELSNFKNKNRQFNRLIKTFDLLSTYSLSPEQQRQIDSMKAIINKI